MPVRADTPIGTVTAGIPVRLARKANRITAEVAPASERPAAAASSGRRGATHAAAGVTSTSHSSANRRRTRAMACERTH
jgi:hypothetical protein